jgi:hypothetical protein
LPLNLSATSNWVFHALISHNKMKYLTIDSYRKQNLFVNHLEPFCFTFCLALRSCFIKCALCLFQTFLAIAVPVDIPDKNVFVSYNFESNYKLVTNITEIDEVLFPNLPVSNTFNIKILNKNWPNTLRLTCRKFIKLDFA